ncbi:pentatricopeptide repeat-containing protein At5g67570, chloroplastic-like [Nymphaea colorata]|nr:pentatricopeptide repeat-containing protein At5g67570, chloroplastic-like [Nymphaea colorata]
MAEAQHSTAAASGGATQPGINGGSRGQRSAEAEGAALGSARQGQATSCRGVGRQRRLSDVSVRQKMHWNRCLEPYVVVYNSVLNACATHKRWKGAVWVLEKLKHNGLKPSSATYGLAMEVMLKAGKYVLVHKSFGKMRKRGLAPNSHTYKVLVTAYWREGKIDDAVEAVLDMERRGVVGSASVYYELACCNLQ